MRLFKQLFTFALMLVVIPAFAAKNFKVDNITYSIQDDGVQLKKAKNVTGDFVVPRMVFDPKTQRAYDVTSIGKGAFKKSAITGLLVPGTVKEIGVSAFERCRNLKTVKIQNGSLESIHNYAFLSCQNLEDISLPSMLEYIGGFAFYDCNLQELTIPGNVRDIKYSAFKKNENLEKVVLSPARKRFQRKYIDGGKEKVDTPYVTITFADSVFAQCDIKKFTCNRNLIFNSNVHLIPTLKSITIGPDVVIVPDRLLIGCRRLEVFDVASTFPISAYETLLKEASGYPFKEVRDYEDLSKRVSTLKFQLAVDGEIKKSYEDAMDALLYTHRYDAFIKRFAAYVDAAENNPGRANNIAMGGSSKDFDIYKDIVRTALEILADSVYIPKKKLTNKDEAECVNGIANNLAALILMDHGLKYAKADLTTSRLGEFLNKDLDAREKGISSGHKEDYERILGLAELMLSYDKKQPYYMFIQEFALTGLGRFKEASNYYPAVHRSVTENGTYQPGDELLILRRVINEHGGKAVDPKYSRGGSKSGNSNLAAIKFFFNRGVEIYQERRAEKLAKKRAEEMFRESVGAPKKGKKK